MDTSILICIFNYRNDDNSKRWLNLLSPYFETVVLDSGNDHEEKDFIQFENIYYSGLFNEMKKLSEKKNYKWIGQICSDVTIDSANSEKLIKKIQNLDSLTKVGIWQPGQDATSRRHWAYKKILDKTGFFSTNIIEGWMHFIRKELLDKVDFVDTSVNRYGYGIDILESYVSNQNGYKNIRDTNVLVHNPPGTGYDNNSALAQGNSYLKKILGNNLMFYVSRYRLSLISEQELNSDTVETENIIKEEKVYNNVITSIYPQVTVVKKRHNNMQGIIKKVRRRKF